ERLLATLEMKGTPPETPPGDSGDERNTLDERNAPWRLLEIKRTTSRDSWR
ncbi:3481_t:CDS:2, partial [Rhizophagus irregularis]